MIPPDEVHFAEDGLTGEVGREVVDPGYGVPIILSDAVKLPEVSAGAIVPQAWLPHG